MKRLALIGMVLVLALALRGAALAAGPKVPKQLCLNGGDLGTLSLAIKMAGTVNKQSGPVKFYSINGESHISPPLQGIYSQPVVGTGHMKGTVFHFSLIGTHVYTKTKELRTYVLEAEWDLANPSAQNIYARLIEDAIYGNTTISCSIVDCALDDLPY